MLPVPPSPSMLMHLPARLLPWTVHSRLSALMLNHLFAEALQYGELDFLSARVLQIKVSDLGLEYRYTLSQNRIQAAPPQAAIDVCFIGSAKDFLRLALAEEDPDTLFFQRRLQLSGDTELGLAIKNFLYSIDQGFLPPPLQMIARKILQYSPN